MYSYYDAFYNSISPKRVEIIVKIHLGGELCGHLFKSSIVNLLAQVSV